MNADLWLRAANIIPPPHRRGGQELILPEVCAALPSPPAVVFLPFPGPTLYWRLLTLGYDVVSEEHKDWITRPFPEADAVYFGTPTIVGDRVLFPESCSDPGRWTKAMEREVVRVLAEAFRERVIVSGLGSGDITVEERIADLGGGRVVAFKDFGTFQDWVIVGGLT